MKRSTVISWFLTLALTSPLGAHAEESAWIQDQNGCKVANPNPQAQETVTWSGACEDGQANGEGVLQWFENGTPTARYEGQLVKGWADGKGTLVTPDGTSYKGEWKQSREHGSGRMEWPNQTWYEGEWRNGKPHGYGQYRTPEGRLVTGRFVDGEFEPSPKEEQPLTDDQSRT